MTRSIKIFNPERHEDRRFKAPSGYISSLEKGVLFFEIWSYGFVSDSFLLEKFVKGITHSLDQTQIFLLCKPVPDKMRNSPNLPRVVLESHIEGNLITLRTDLKNAFQVFDLFGNYEKWAFCIVVDKALSCTEISRISVQIDIKDFLEQSFLFKFVFLVDLDGGAFGFFSRPHDFNKLEKTLADLEEKLI